MGVAGRSFFTTAGYLKLDMGNFGKGQRICKSGLRNGYPLPGLRNKLTHARAEKNKTEKLGELSAALQVRCAWPAQNRYLRAFAMNALSHKASHPVH